ncbi:MAG: ankyrin repeat domain-containing protein, partial [Anaplasma ovis]
MPSEYPIVPKYQEQNINAARERDKGSRTSVPVAEDYPMPGVLQHEEREHNLDAAKEKDEGDGVSAPEQKHPMQGVPTLSPREQARRALTSALDSMQHDDYAEFVAHLANVPEEHKDTRLFETDLKTILHHACSMGDPKYASYLLEHEYNMSAVDVQANTPLHCAATAIDNQSAERLQLILHSIGMTHPSARATNLKGEAPIHSAVACENFENVKALVNLSDHCVLDLESRTFLHRAARNQSDDFVSNVLRHVLERAAEAPPEKAGPYEKLLCSEDLSGYMPVHYAAKRGLQYAGVTMLEATVAQAERRRGEDGIRDILGHMGGAGNTILNCAAKGKCEPVLQAAISAYKQHHMAGFSIQDDENRAPIHNAASYVSADLFSQMLENTDVLAYGKHTKDGSNLLTLVMQDKTDRSRRQEKIKLCLGVPEIASWINTPGPNGMVPLCEMYLEGNSTEHIYIQDLLKSESVDVDSRCTDGRSVIHLAAEKGDVRALEMLLSSRQAAKGDAKFPTSDGHYTPAIHVLKTRGDDATTLEVLKRLIPQEPSLEDIAFHAARSGNYRVLKYITDSSQNHRIDVNCRLRDAEGNAVSICGELLRNGHLNIANELVRTQGAKLEGIDSQCALSSAIQGKCFAGNGGNIAGTTWLERTLAQLKMIFAELSDAFVQAFSKGITVERGIKSLLKNGAEIHGYEVDSTTLGDDDTPLIFAIKHAQQLDSTLIPRFLIRNGANVNCRDRVGNTALHAAVELLKFPDKQAYAQECVDLLCDRGASARQRNAQGYTPLHMAAAYKNVHAFESILKSNKLSALDRSSTNGSSALHIAMNSGVGESEIVKMLKSCKKVLAPVELEQMLSAYDSSGNTLMHVAAKLDFKNVVAFGLANGALMSIQNAAGKLAHELAPPSGNIASGRTALVGSTVASKMIAQVASEGGGRSYTTIKVDPEFLMSTSRIRRGMRAPTNKAGSVANKVPAAAMGSVANDDNRRNTEPLGPGSTGDPSQGGSGMPAVHGPDKRTDARAPEQSMQRPSAPELSTPGDEVEQDDIGPHSHSSTAGPGAGATAPTTSPIPPSFAWNRGGPRDYSAPPPYSSVVANDSSTTPAGTTVEQDGTTPTVAGAERDTADLQSGMVAEAPEAARDTTVEQDDTPTPTVAGAER